MKARLLERPPAVGGWVYEIKHDGFRILAVKNGPEVELFSRNQRDLAAKFPEIAAEVRKIRASDLIIDGEVVALEPTGKSSFQLLQAYEIGEERPPIVFFVFDLLRLNGRDLKREPLMCRKELLGELFRKAHGTKVRVSDSLEGDVENLLDQARKLGLEGLIGKRKDSVYEAGQRSGAWIKLKITSEQEFVIGGYTNPQGSRKCFGSLLVGFYRGGKLYFAGKVGTGFDDAWLKRLYRELKMIEAPTCPFVNLPETKGSRYSPGLTASEMRKCHWVEPKIVCQVRYTEWTRDGKLRHPVFLGLRPDKNPRDVVFERAE